MLLRVCVAPNNVRRINLPSLPESVDHLKRILQSKLELKDGFSLQFEDPEFGNLLCNLHDIDELPAERAILKVIWDEVTLEVNPPPPTSDTSDAGSVSSLDVVNVSSASSSSMSSETSNKNLKDAVVWPYPFEIPKFSLDVELRLKKANEIYHQTKMPLDIPRDIKSEILSKLVQVMFEVKSYPTRCEVQSVAIALVQKHPCLTEDHPSSGWDAWVTSLWFKVGNYRFKLRQAGMSEVSVNRKRRTEDGQVKFCLKKSRRSEVNFLPDHAEGQTEETLEEDRLEMIEETKKKNYDASLIRQKMHSTFSLRRREVVEVEPFVKEMKERWPALFLTDEICSEFHRIAKIDLMATFQSSLEKYTPALLKLYRSKKEPEFRALLDPLDEQVMAIAEHRKRVALEGLPLYLKEDSASLFKKCLDTDAEEDYTKDVKIGILTAIEDDVAAVKSLPTVINTAIILEETVVLQDIKDVPSAFAYLFGLLYAINMEYPKNLKYTFEVIQKIFLGLGGNSCSARTQSLRSKMLACLR